MHLMMQFKNPCLQTITCIIEYIFNYCIIMKYNQKYFFVKLYLTKI